MIPSSVKLLLKMGSLVFILHNSYSQNKQILAFDIGANTVVSYKDPISRKQHILPGFEVGLSSLIPFDKRISLTPELKMYFTNLGFERPSLNENDNTPVLISDRYLNRSFDFNLPFRFFLTRNFYLSLGPYIQYLQLIREKRTIYDEKSRAILSKSTRKIEFLQSEKVYVGGLLSGGILVNQFDFRLIYRYGDTIFQAAFPQQGQLTSLSVRYWFSSRRSTASPARPSL